MAPPQRQPQRGGVPDRADDGVNQDGAQVGEEELVGHAVAGVQHDRRQQVKEEDGRGELEGLDLVRAPDYPAQDEAEADEQGAFRDVVGDAVVGLDDWRETKVRGSVRHISFEMKTQRGLWFTADFKPIIMSSAYTVFVYLF